MTDYLLGVTGLLDNVGDVEEQKSIASSAYADALAKYDTAVQKQGLVDTVIESTTPAIIAVVAPTAVKFLASTYRSVFGLPQAGTTPATGGGSSSSAGAAPEEGAVEAPELPTGSFGDVEGEIAEFGESLGELGGISAAPVVEGVGGIVSAIGSTVSEVGAGVVSLGSTLATSTAGIISAVPGAVSTGLNVATDIAATTGSVGDAVAGGVEAAATGLDLTGIGAAVGLVLGAGALIYSLVETFKPHHAPKAPPVEQVAQLEAQPQARL
jgi:hypothetical protein